MTLFAALERDNLEVHPGGGASVPLTIRNTGAVVNEYRFEVLGPTAAWAEVEPAVLPLFPGQDGSVTVSWRPPRTPDARAGRMPFGIRVLPSYQPEDSLVEEGFLTVAPFYAMGVTLVPVTSRGRFFGAHRIMLENQSNSDAAVALAALDPDALLRFRMRPTAFRLKQGATRPIRMRVTPRHHKFKGPPEHRNFQVFASLQGQDPVRADGIYQQRALIAGWQFKVAVLALLLLLAAILIPQFRQGEAHTLAVASVPVPPVPVVATATGPTAIRVTWSGAGSSIDTGYQIQLAGQTVATASSDETAHVFTGLTTGHTYCYVVKALDSKNSRAPASAFSPPACATPASATVVSHAAPPASTATVASAPPPAPGAPPAPVPVTAQVLDPSDIKLTWTPQGNPQSYVIQDSGQQVATPPGTSSAQVFSGLAPGSQHCYVIWAVGPGGASPHVGPLCATTIFPPGAPVPPVPSNVTVTPVSNNGLQVSWAADPTNVTTSYQIFENGSLAATQPAGATANTFTNLPPGSHHCYAVRALAGTAASAFAPDACATVNAGVPATVNLTQPGIFGVSVASITPSEGDGRAVIGATVNYAITVNIPVSGTTHTDLLFTLPSGLSLKSTNSNPQVSLGAVSSSLQTDYPGGFAAAAAAATYTPQGGLPPGQRLDVPLGDITNSSGDQTVAQTITVNVPAVVLNADDVSDGMALAASASLQTYNNGAPVASPAVTSTITVASPPSINLSETPTGSLTITLPESAGSVIYDVSVFTGLCSSCTLAQTIPQVASGPGATINLPACSAQVTVEWLSAPFPNGPVSQIEGPYAYPRYGPDITPVGNPTPQQGTQKGASNKQELTGVVCG